MTIEDIWDSEWRVICAACEYDDDAQDIADRLGMTRDSLYVMLSRIYNKLGLRNRRELRDWYEQEFPSS